MPVPPSRCEEPGELPPGGERPGAGERSAAGLLHVQLPPADGQVRSAPAPAAGNTRRQHAGRGVPVLQAPKRGRSLQQPAHRDAARQACLRASAPINHPPRPRTLVQSPPPPVQTSPHPYRHTSKRCSRGVGRLDVRRVYNWIDCKWLQCFQVTNSKRPH